MTFKEEIGKLLHYKTKSLAEQRENTKESQKLLNPAELPVIVKK